MILSTQRYALALVVLPGILALFAAPARADNVADLFDEDEIVPLLAPLSFNDTVTVLHEWRLRADAIKKDENKPGREDAPVNIMAAGNRLIITSDDPQALELINQLVRLMTTTQTAEGDIEIIRLKNASATEAARILD